LLLGFTDAPPLSACAGTTGFSVWSEDRKKTPPWYDETEE